MKIMSPAALSFLPSKLFRRGAKTSGKPRSNTDGDAQKGSVTSSIVSAISGKRIAATSMKGGNVSQPAQPSHVPTRVEPPPHESVTSSTAQSTSLVQQPATMTISAVPPPSPTAPLAPTASQTTLSVQPTNTTTYLPGTPLDQASGYTRRKHSPPEEQLQGGSWTLDTVTGTYRLGSRVVKDGRMLPSPADPSVYDKMYQIAAEMAKLGDCRMAQHLSVPERYLEPNFIPESFAPGSEFSEKLCLECSAIVERLYIEIFLKQRGETDPLYGPYRSPLDVDIRPSIDALSRSAKDGCGMCNFILGMLQQLSPHRLERHMRASGSGDFPIQITGGTGEYYRLIVWLRKSKDRDLSKRTKAFEMCATLARGMKLFLCALDIWLWCS